MKMMRICSIVFLSLLGFAIAGTAQATTVTVSMRYQGTLALDHVLFELPTLGTITVTDTAGGSHAVNSQTVLGVLATMDPAYPAFLLSQLVYNAGYDALYVDCITLAESGEQCSNWLYAVNSSIAGQGMASYILSGGEDVFLFFGSPRDVAVNTAQVPAGSPFVVTAREYRYETNTWVPAPGVTIGVFSGSYWDPVVVQSKVADTVGQALFVIGILGSYGIGIAEDFYYPSLDIVVGNAVSGGSMAPIKIQPSAKTSFAPFNVEKAAQFISSLQKDNGSFGSPMLSDWVTIALSASQIKSALQNDKALDKLRSYVLSDFSPGPALLDKERRAMALLSLGEDFASLILSKYIKDIEASFDGSQFGDPAQLNDDVFAILALRGVGVLESDPMISRAVEFALSWQNDAGAFLNDDMTGATAQALSQVSLIPGVSEALEKAKAYLSLKNQKQGSAQNVYTASWVMQGLSSLGEKVDSVFLSSQQAGDGGVEWGKTEDMRMWATSYAIPAALGMSWPDIFLQSRSPLAIETDNVVVQKENAIVKLDQELQRIQREVNRIALEVQDIQVRVIAFLGESRIFAVVTDDPDAEEGFGSVEPPISTDFSLLFLEKGVTASIAEQVLEKDKKNFFITIPGILLFAGGLGVGLFLVISKISIMSLVKMIKHA